MTTTTAIAELLRSAAVRPDDAPGTAAALLWGSIAETYGLRPDSPVAGLGVVDRVVLVLLDVAQLAEQQVAAELNTDVETIRHAHEQARARIGLPAVGVPACARWDDVRAAHGVADPNALDALMTHLTDCDRCGVAERSTDHRRAVRRSTAIATPTVGGVFTLIPALAVGLALAAAVGAGGMALREARISSTSPADLPVPVVVDDAPGLPSDEAPDEGWPDATDPVLDADGATGDGGADAGNDVVGDVTDTVTDTLDDVTDRVTDTLDDVTDAVDDLVDDVEDLVDDVTDGIGGVTDGVDGIGAPGDLLP